MLKFLKPMLVVNATLGNLLFALLLTARSIMKSRAAGKSLNLVGRMHYPIARLFVVFVGLHLLMNISYFKTVATDLIAALKE